MREISDKKVYDRLQFINSSRQATFGIGLGCLVSMTAFSQATPAQGIGYKRGAKERDERLSPFHPRRPFNGNLGGIWGKYPQHSLLCPQDL